MPKLRVHSFSISLDGYGAGPGQSLDDPLGVGGTALHEWFVPTRTFQQVHGKEGGHDRCRRRVRGARSREYRRVDHGPQHVRAGSRTLA